MTLGQGEPIPAGMLDLFTEQATQAATRAAESAMLALIQREKQKVIEETKRAIVPTVIGVGLAAGAASAALVAWLMTRRQ